VIRCRKYTGARDNDTAAGVGAAPKAGGVDDGDPRGCTAYHHACAGGQLECVKLLLRAGAGTLATSAGAETGWDLAAQVQGKSDGRSREKQRPNMVGNVAHTVVQLY
jgi:hypothetical protein